jgi:hypothetical protein
VLTDLAIADLIAFGFPVVAGLLVAFLELISYHHDCAAATSGQSFFGFDLDLIVVFVGGGVVGGWGLVVIILFFFFVVFSEPALTAVFRSIFLLFLIKYLRSSLRPILRHLHRSHILKIFRLLHPIPG